LSLSYDIIKSHGGELKVETKEGVGSTFIISLPVTMVNKINGDAGTLVKTGTASGKIPE